MKIADISQVFDLLESVDGYITIPGAMIMGFVTHTQTSDSEDDLSFGCVNTSDINLTVLGVKGSAAAYTGREFRYSKGYCGEPVKTRLTRAADSIVSREDVTAFSKGKLLTVTKGADKWTYTLPAPAGALVLKNEKDLYVLYSGAPFAQHFLTTEEDTSDHAVPSMTYYENQIASDYAQQGESFAYLPGGVAPVTRMEITKIETVLGRRTLFTTPVDLVQKGFFTAERPRRGTGDQFSIRAYDRMTRFEVDCEEVLVGETLGTSTHRELLNKLCEFVKVSPVKQTFATEADPQNIPASQETVTGSQILTWLGELMATSWRINEQGELLGFLWADAKESPIPMADYSTFSYETYEVEPIAKVLLGSAVSGDVGSGGDGVNALVIKDNPLVPFKDKDTLNAAAKVLVDVAKGITAYHPGNLVGFTGRQIQPGDMLSVETEEGDFRIRASQVTESGFSVQIESRGNQHRGTLNYNSLSGSTLQQVVGDLQNQVSSFPDLWNKSIADTVALITGATGGTRVDLFQPGTQIPSGTAYLYDSSDIRTAKELLVLNAGGIAFYDKGFNIDDPSLSEPAFVVMDKKGHVNASAILTGTLTANLIKAGILSDLKNKNSINLETGEVNLDCETLKIQGKTTEEIANQAASDPASKMTQTEVFNLLTNNGKLQGLYMDKGNLYVNSSYIKTGTLDGDNITVQNLKAGAVVSGSLKSKNGKAVFDLDNNDLVCKDGNYGIRLKGYGGGGLDLLYGTSVVGRLFGYSGGHSGIAMDYFMCGQGNQPHIFMSHDQYGNTSLNVHNAELKNSVKIGSAGTNGGKVGFFGTNPTTKKTVWKISNTGSATASSVASKVNEILDALRNYGLLNT